MHMLRSLGTTRVVLAIAMAALIVGCGAKPGPMPTVAAARATPKVVDDFGLHDQHGQFHRLYYYADAPAIVLYVQGNGCPIVRNGVSALDAIRAEYGDHEDDFSWRIQS